MGARRYALIVFAALCVLFLASNVIVGKWFAGARLDLTENGLYSLSPGTKRTIASLNEPITLTLYFSQDAAAEIPQLRTYGARVRELLQTYADRSRGQVRVVEIDPVRFTEAEDQAVAAGVAPLQVEGADPIYLGVGGVNAVDERVAIPRLTPDREPFLEYEITRLVSELQNPARKKAALITALPWEPSIATEQGARQPFVLSELARAAEVTKLAPDFTAIPADTDILVIVHPWPLSEAQTYAVDQFVMQKGRAFVALDPALAAPPMSALGTPAAPSASALPTLLAAWGVEMGADAVLDRENALPVQNSGANGQPVAVPQPLFFRVTPDATDRDDLVTAGLSRGIAVGAPGAISWRNQPDRTVTPLAWTSATTMRLPGDQAAMRPDPVQLLQNFVPQSRRETLAVRIAGKLRSAFPSPPPGAGNHLAQSQGDGMIVLASDVDFLDDNFYLGQGGEPIFDNAAFVLNAIDQLGGSDALVSLRSRAPSYRGMEVVDRIRNEATVRLLATQQKLEAEREATSRALQALAQRGRSSGFFEGNLRAALTPEERAEIERLRTREVEVRRQLRNVERGYRVELDRLEGWLLLINVWLAPLLVVGVGAFLLWRRTQHPQARAHEDNTPTPEAPAQEAQA